MYKSQTDALARDGYVEAGYTGIHMDDCWENKHPARDPATQELMPNATRFPSGLKALGDYMHSKGATFGLYTAESPSTCGGYPASANMESTDAKLFASWGVDYLKVDGCGPADYYAHGYQAMGAALEASGRDIVYSCSWPAYINGEKYVSRRCPRTFDRYALRRTHTNHALTHTHAARRFSHLRHS